MDPATGVAPFLTLIVVCLAGGVGFVGGHLLHRDPRDMLLPDVLQGVFGAVLCLEVYAATGLHSPTATEVVGVGLIGALVAVGISHLTSGLVRRMGRRA